MTYAEGAIEKRRVACDPQDINPSPGMLADCDDHRRAERGQARTQGVLPEGQAFEKQDIIAEALREWFEERGYLK